MYHSVVCNTLERNNVSLTNRTVDLFFFETMVNSTALIDELYRIQEANPTFVPLLETLAVDWLQLDVSIFTIVQRFCVASGLKLCAVLAVGFLNQQSVGIQFGKQYWK